MTKFESGKKNINDTKAKAIKGYKRLSVFANASALAVLAGHAGLTVYGELHKGDHDVPTAILTFATVLVGATALVLYIKFFTED